MGCEATTEAICQMLCTCLSIGKENILNTSQAAPGALAHRSPPATLHHLQNPKWMPGVPEMVKGLLKKRGRGKKITMEIVATSVISN